MRALPLPRLRQSDASARSCCSSRLGWALCATAFAVTSLCTVMWLWSVWWPGERGSLFLSELGDCAWPVPAQLYTSPADRCATLAVQLSVQSFLEPSAGVPDMKGFGRGAESLYGGCDPRSVGRGGDAAGCADDSPGLVRLAWRQRIRRDFNLLHPTFAPPAIDAAFKNLQHGTPLPDGTIPGLIGLRVQIIGGRIHIMPMAPDAAEGILAKPWDRAWLMYTVSSVLMLSNVVARHRVPDVDFTILFGDQCFGLDKFERDREHRHLRNASLLSLPPLMTYNYLPDCHAVAFPMFDWMFPGQNFLPGSNWRYDSVPQEARPPWAQRRDALLFRGGIASWDHLRLRIFRLGLVHPASLLDVKAAHFAALPDCMRDYNESVRSRGGPVLGSVEADCASIANGTSLSAAEQMRYKYILDADGHGATFRNKNLFLSGDLVFKVESPVRQFYFEDLRPWVHYVPVSRDTLEEDLPNKVLWARANDVEAAAIAARGEAFARGILTHEAAWWYQAEVLREYASRQEAPPAAPDPRARLFCCEDLFPQVANSNAYPPREFNLTAICKQTFACVRRPGENSSLPTNLR